MLITSGPRQSVVKKSTPEHGQRRVLCTSCRGGRKDCFRGAEVGAGTEYEGMRAATAPLMQAVQHLLAVRHLLDDEDTDCRLLAATVHNSRGSACGQCCRACRRCQQRAELLLSWSAGSACDRALWHVTRLREHCDYGGGATHRLLQHSTSSLQVAHE